MSYFATGTVLLALAFATATDLEASEGTWSIEGKECGVCYSNFKINPNLLETQKHFLPDNDHAKRTCKAPNAIAELMQRQISFVTSKECNLHRRFRPRSMENGFGATMMSLIKPVLHSLTYGYCIDQPKKYQMWSSPSCSGWQCFFQAIGQDYNSSFSFASTEATAKVHQEAAAAMMTERVDPRKKCIRWWEMQYDADGDVYGPLQEECAMMFSTAINMDEALPHAFRSEGLFFNVAQITNMFYKLSDKVVKRINEKKKRIGFPRTSQVLGLHVRLGDACIKSENSVTSHARHCNQLKDFMPHVKTMSAKYKIKNVYLATDSQKVIKDTELYPQFNWIYDKTMRRGGILTKKSIEYSLEHKLIDGYEEGLGVIEDVWLLADCDALVGKFTSNIDRVAYQLMSGRSNCLRPFISMDSPWCFDHGLKTGVGDFGSFWC